MPGCIVWFRQDLRLQDNPALSAALALGGPVLPVWILDDAGEGDWAAGGATRWWLHHSRHERPLQPPLRTGGHQARHRHQGGAHPRRH